MPRPSQLVLAASLAAIAVGCAHCDTCDDFPAPCTGPNCGYPYQATFPYDGESHIEPIVTGPTMGMPAGQIAPGTIVGAPTPGAAPASPPSSAPALAPPRSPSSPNGPSGAAPTTSPPVSPPARPEGGDPFDIPLPPADSPFSRPSTN